MDDGNKNGNKLQVSFAPTPPRKPLPLLEHKVITDRRCQIPGKKVIFTPGFQNVSSASELLIKKEEKKQVE